MGYIYRYELRNKRIRQNINLSEWKYDIIKVIKEMFEENLKDSRVTKEFFEFKLYESVENKILRNMGERLNYVIQKIRVSNSNVCNIRKIGFF